MVCSDFCTFLTEYFEKRIRNVLDCGCGDGRDSYALSKLYVVDGLDNCGFLPVNDVNVNFSKDDFVTVNKEKYDLIYSRFTFHSITDEQHEIFLDSVCSKTYLAIETRSKLGENDSVIHGKTHYRNYTDINYLKKLLLSKNFEILFINEGRNYAKYKDEDPVCIRVICKRN